MEAQIKTLKKGGKLIVSVPNNKGFLGDSENILNLPPHHMGLWEEDSLKKMGDFFNLKYQSTHFEPLQDYHKDYYNTIRSEKLRKYNKIYSLITRLKFLDKIIFPREYKAFTVQMTWIK